ncbi:MAG: hypothetical protein RIB93_13010 [Coleofasciculus sp. D1-CHI-01]
MPNWDAPNYLAFVTQVLELADNFDYEEILKLIDQYYDYGGKMTTC